MMMFSRALLSAFIFATLLFLMTITSGTNGSIRRSPAVFIGPAAVFAASVSAALARDGAAAPPPDCCVGRGAAIVCWVKPANAFTMIFYSNALGYRGTEVALYDYASEFEERACGRAVIAAPAEALDMSGRAKFEKRFPKSHPPPLCRIFVKKESPT